MWLVYQVLALQRIWNKRKYLNKNFIFAHKYNSYLDVCTAFQLQLMHTNHKFVKAKTIEKRMNKTKCEICTMRVHIQYTHKSQSFKLTLLRICV